MTLIAGTNIAAPIVPYDTADNQATHRDIYGQGGLRTVADQTALLAIKSNRCVTGMLVYRIDDDTYYKLKSGYSDPLLIGDFEAFGGGGAEEWVMPPADDWYDPTGGLPVAPTIGDRYIADDTGNGWTQDYVYEWDGSNWIEYPPEEGWMIWMLFELIFYVFFSGGWMEVGAESFLKLDGSNANSNIDIGAYDFATTGAIAGGAITGTTFNAGTLSGNNSGDQTINGETGTSITLTTGDIGEDTDKNYVSDAELVVLQATSGSNTGDQDLSALALKTNVLELDNVSVFTPDADYEPATKKYVDDNIPSGVISFEGGTANGSILKKKSDTEMEAVTGISELLIVSAHSLATFVHTAGIQEKGETLNAFNLNWTYNRNGDDPTSQEIDNGIGVLAVALRTYAVSGAGLTTDTTYQIDAIGDDTNPSSRTATVYFRNKRYWGASATVLNASSTGAQVRSALSGDEFGTSIGVTKTFDASGNEPDGKFLYYCYPTSWGLPSTSKVGGLDYSDYTSYTITAFENASAHTENYYLLVSNSAQNGAAITWQIG